MERGKELKESACSVVGNEKERKTKERERSEAHETEGGKLRGMA